MAEENITKPAENTAVPAPAVPEGKFRNGLIFGTLAVFASIIFGLIYLFVIAPSAPASGDGWSVGWFLFSFATGLTMIVMPCTLPLAFVIVPLSMGKGLIKGLGMAVSFGLGVAATLSIYGILAALLGGLALDTLGTDLEVVKNWVYFVAGLFALVFALSEIGLLNFHMPTYSGAAPAFIQKRQEVFKAFLLGLFLGNIGVGCPHPATPLLLIEIATSGDIWYGWLMFLVHAIGRVLPLLLLAFMAILGVNGLSWLMSRKETVERVTGWAMVFVAGFILTLGLFTHDWWVNSGIHTALEAVTQEAFFNTLLNDNFETNVAHLHGPEEGEGLFGLPLHWGHWFLVFVWIFPMWWWWARKRKDLLNKPSFKLKALEKKIDLLEKDRRQVESIVNLDEAENDFDLSARHAQLDSLEAERRAAEERVQYAETGILKNPIAQTYEFKILKMHRNYLFAISILLALIFIHFMPDNFMLKSLSGGGHHGAAESSSGHDHSTCDESHEGSCAATGGSVGTADGKSLEGIHTMGDGLIMNALGETFPGAHVMDDGTFMFADGSMYNPNLGNIPTGATLFSTSVDGLPAANDPETVELADGESYDITASYVQKEVGNRTLRMLAYNGSVPGPFIKSEEGAEITINFTNNTDVDQTIHSHGLRLDNLSDGVPYVTQDPVKPGDSYTYTIKFEDGGVFWYHPHTKSEYGLEMGLYGNYLVTPEIPYPGSVDREVPLILDDILIENDRIFDFYKETTNFALLGRFGNEFLVNGEESFSLPVQPGEVIRFFVTNVSNARTYNLSIPGVQIKKVGADLSRYEREEFAESIIISPAERMVIEAYFEEAGTYSLVNTVPGTDATTELASFVVAGNAITPYETSFNTLHVNEEIVDEFSTFRSYLNTDPNKNLLLTVQIEGSVDHSMHTGHAHAGAAPAPPLPRIETIQWDDSGATDKVNTSENIVWKMIDQDTGAEGMMIPTKDWTFTEGDLVKIRYTNDANADHVMQHPIHLHGQQFVVLSENGVPNDNLAWKDTVLVYPGEVVDILVQMSTSGEWMSHCHIAEHLHAGMMMQFRVQDETGYSIGDEYRATVDPAFLMNHGEMGMTTTAPATVDPALLDKYSFNSAVTTNGYDAVPQDTRFRANRNEEISISIFDSVHESVLTSSSHPTPLAITFVDSTNANKVYTFPGNTAFDTFIPHGSAGHDDSDGHHGDVPSVPADDGHDHIHMNENEKVFALIPRAIAHGGVEDGHPNGTGQVYSYTMPVVFPEKGFYRAFVEFVPDGSTEVQTVTFDIEVASDSFSVDNFGWSFTKKWTVLLIVSLISMALLSRYVYRYLAVKE